MGIERYYIASHVRCNVAGLQKESPNMGIESSRMLENLYFLSSALAKRVPKHGD